MIQKRTHGPSFNLQRPNSSQFGPVLDISDGITITAHTNVILSLLHEKLIENVVILFIFHFIRVPLHLFRIDNLD